MAKDLTRGGKKAERKGKTVKFVLHVGESSSISVLTESLMFLKKKTEGCLSKGRRRKVKENHDPKQQIINIMSNTIYASRNFKN